MKLRLDNLNVRLFLIIILVSEGFFEKSKKQLAYSKRYTY